MLNSNLIENMNNFIRDVEELELEQATRLRTKERLADNVKELQEANASSYSDLDLVTNAITILREVSDEAVQNSYEFITDNINAALERIFNRAVRKIRLKEYTRAGQYPQLELELIVENGKVRSLKNDSGHGLMQIISLLCVLSVIVLTGSRRVFVIDEVLSGLSENSRKIVAEILWTFTEIGFQFIVSEHGFIPKGSKVYHLKMTGGISGVDREYIEESGVYIMEDMKEDSIYRGEVSGELKNGNVIQI